MATGRQAYALEHFDAFRYFDLPPGTVWYVPTEDVIVLGTLPPEPPPHRQSHYWTRYQQTQRAPWDGTVPTPLPPDDPNVCDCPCKVCRSAPPIRHFHSPKNGHYLLPEPPKGRHLRR